MDIKDLEFKIEKEFKIVNKQKSIFSGQYIYMLECNKCKKVINIAFNELIDDNGIECECGNICRLKPIEEKSNECFENKACIDSKGDESTSRINSKDRQRLRKVRQIIINRCYNERYQSYHLYGGIGICVEDKWLKDVKSFINWSINNGYKPWLNLKRINRDGHYSESNCYWGNKEVIVKNCESNNDKQEGMEKIIGYIQTEGDITKVIEVMNKKLIEGSIDKKYITKDIRRINKKLDMILTDLKGIEAVLGIYNSVKVMEILGINDVIKLINDAKYNITRCIKSADTMKVKDKEE